MNNFNEFTFFQRLIHIRRKRVLDSKVECIVSKKQTQQLEKTNEIVRQHKEPRHHRQNKFAKMSGQTEVSIRENV